MTGLTMGVGIHSGVQMTCRCGEGGSLGNSVLSTDLVRVGLG